jgi:hypothetical protein
MILVANYLNQQKHFIRGLFDPPYLEPNIIMFAEFVENLGRLVVPLLKDTFWLTCLSPARIFSSENLSHK